MNVAGSLEDSRFPDIRLPGGISSKAAKYREMAREGEGWRCPIFDIGNASASSDIPPPKKITRKSPHGYLRATINERAAGDSHSDPKEQVGGTSFYSKGSTALPGRNGYQPSMSTATDSLSTAVEPDDLIDTRRGDYNGTGSNFAQGRGAW